MTFTSWLRGLTRGSASTLRKARSAGPRAGGARFRPSVEVLEDRVVPSATLLTTTITTADFNNDGKVDAIYSTTQSVDNHHNLLSSVQANDYNADGTVDDRRSLTQQIHLGDQE